MPQRPNVVLLPISCLFLITLFLSCDRYGEPEPHPTNGLTQIECSGSELDSTIYYVSTTGNDDADGLSESTAFRSIAKGIEAVHPGGTVRILPGVWHEGVAISNCGSEDAPITIEGFNGRPILDGKKKWTMGIFCDNCINFRFRNLEFKNYSDIGILISTSRKIILDSLLVKENGHKVQLKALQIEGYGIDVEYSQAIEILNCEVLKNGPKPQIFPDAILGRGIHSYSNQDVLIRNNTCFRNIGGGILVADCNGVIVEDNEVYENDLDATIIQKWDGGIWLDGGSNVSIRNNNLHDNLGPGLQISDQKDQSPTGYQLSNNVSTGNYYGVYVWNFGTLDWPDSSIITRQENDWSGNSREDVWIKAGN